MEVNEIGKITNCSDCNGKRYTVYRRKRKKNINPFVEDPLLKYIFVKVGVYCENCNVIRR